MRSNQIKARLNGYFILHASPECVVLGAFCCSTVRIPLYSCSDQSRNCHVRAPVNHTFNFLIFCPHVPLPESAFLPTLDARPPPPPQTPAQDTSERITPSPTSTASHLSFLPSPFSSFSSYFGQQRSTLSCSRAAPVRPLFNH